MTLLMQDNSGIQKLLESMEKTCADIRKSALRMAWYMRGGASYEDILNMSSFERIELSKLIESNLETTKETKMPFF